MTKEIKRVGILFAGGPAPAANSVIAAAAMSFIKHGIEVIGFKHGYSCFENFSLVNPLIEGRDYVVLDFDTCSEARNQRGIMIGTARINAGRYVKNAEDLKDTEKTAPLRRVYDGLRSLKIDALISIGGDDTLKTANKMHAFQAYLPEGSPKIKVVHLPKTIDNDYKGIDFTFGFFTAVHWMGLEVQNLKADAKAARAIYIAECMGRKAGWLSYGVAIAGEANLVVSVEDIDALMTNAGKSNNNGKLDLDVLVDYIEKHLIKREEIGLNYAVVVLAEGLVEHLPDDLLRETTTDEHGHMSLGDVQLNRLVAKKLIERYIKRTGHKKKITGVQMGYESRCAAPHAFDVMLGSQLGAGAYKALIEENLDGVMVSTIGQLDLTYVPFEQLIDPETLITEVRFIEPGSDFWKLARFMEH